MPLPAISSYFAALAPNLVIEFVPKEDAMVRKLLATREDVFADFSADWTTNTPQPRGSLLVADPRPADAGPWAWERLSVAGDELNGRFVTGMGEGADGELYVMARRSFGPINRTGIVYRLAPVS